MSLSDLTSREAILQAMKQFDALGRDAFLEKYGFRPAQAYTVEHDGGRYDPKAIAGVAYGLQFPDRGPLKASEFSGGEETVNPLLTRLGFKVSRITIRDRLIGSAALIRENLQTFLNRYPKVRAEKAFGQHDELKPYLQRICDGLADLPALTTRPQIKMHWSLGAGNWASVPWIALMDERETTSTQRGLYGAFLFPEDTSGVFLTLNQGVTEVGREHGRAAGREVLRTRARLFREAASDLAAANFKLDDGIDLKTEVALGQDYEASTIAYKFYDRTDLPPAGEIQSDVEVLLEAYQRVLNSKQPSANSGPATWIFQASPKVFNIDGALEVLQELTWTAGSKSREINQGDQVLLWRSGADAGIIARATVTESAQVIPPREQERPFFVEKTKFEGALPRVVIRVEERFRQPLQRRVIGSVPSLKDLMILRFPNYGIFRLGQEHARILLDMLREASQPGEAPPRIWLYAPGEGAEYWDEYYEQGLMGIGWRSLGDLQQYKSLEDVTNALVEGKRLDNPPINAALACFEFANVMKPGDKIYVKRGRSTVMGYGVVTGPYQYDPTRSEQPNVRAVRWEIRDEWKYPGNLPIKTLTDITDQSDTIADLDRLVRQGAHEPIEQIPPAEREPFSVDDAVAGLFMTRDEFERILAIWRTKKNVILQGPPGVGKSFIAKRLGYALMGYRDQSRVRSVQFHQSYSYEDFVQGYRPSRNGLVLKDGLFYEFCMRAQKDPSQDYVFIVDEINRGNLSKILGELMLLIEGDKRGPEWATKLAYAESEERFYVPPNLYLLGMMNTADRSLSLVDYALRRRFAFVTLAPLYNSPAFRTALEKIGAEPELIERIVARMTDLNAAIAGDAANLGVGFCIGHSFFTQAADGEAPSDEWFQRIVETEIGPLLDEYWFDNPDRAAEWKKKLLA